MISSLFNYSENFNPEDVVLEHARARGVEVGANDISVGTGVFLQQLAHLLSAQSVVEVGTGSGVGSLYLLRGMIDSGTLTSIDDEVEHARIAKMAFYEAEIEAARFRLITNPVMDVLSKLTDRAYDLVILRHDPIDLTYTIDEAHRILRSGGVLVIDSFFGGGKVPDPAQRDPKTIALREAGKRIKTNRDHWQSSLLPVGDGLLIATKLQQDSLMSKPARIFRRKPNQLAFLDDLEESASKKRTLPTASIVVLALVAGLLGGILGGDATKGLISSGVNLVSSTSTIERSPDSIAGIAARVLPSVVSIETMSTDGGASGSGFVIDPNGYLLTNNHVVADAMTIKVILNDGREYVAKILGRDESYDLAVLKIQATGLKALQFGDSDKVQVGDSVIAFGSPLGLSGTVTQGIISAKDRPVTAGDSNSATSFISALQTDAAINPGNSGGPLVDATGAVVGVNSAIASLGSSLGSQSGSIGLGFAIPINQARKTADQLIKDGKATYPVIGVSVDMNYTGSGALIAKTSSAIMAGGPAAKAGLRAGDLITAIDGMKINTPEELIVEIRTHNVGDEVTVTYIRGKQSRTAKLILIAGK